MKLEALNGNLMALTGKTSIQETQCNSQKSDMKYLELEADDDEHKNNGSDADKEEPMEANKKKGTRKKRSLNWEEAERGLLLEALKPKVEYVENRNVDAKTIKAKRLAWLQITKQFNAMNFRHRSLEQIQVQWRSMKNFAKREYQQKYPKSGTIEGMDMIEFMEEILKDPTCTRNQTRNSSSVALAKKDSEIDDEDTPLSALPTSINSSEDGLQTTTIALPSPPPSAGSQNDAEQNTITRKKSKNASSIQNSTSHTTQSHTHRTPSATSAAKIKRQRIQNSFENDASPAAVEIGNHANLQNNSSARSSTPLADDIKYKKQLYELLRSSRLLDIDYIRREHEQKIRFSEDEHELRLAFYRQQEELKLQQMREEHELRMRCYQAEHEARMKTYSINMRKVAKSEYDEKAK